MDKVLKVLFAWLNDHPSSKIIGIARLVLTWYDHKDLPDWVEILANGNTGLVESVVDTAITDAEVTDASE
jgi:hypothetical protein